MATNPPLIKTGEEMLAATNALMAESEKRRASQTDVSDLPIAATALELDYAVGTANTRHFRRVPGLRVIEL